MNDFKPTPTRLRIVSSLRDSYINSASPHSRAAYRCYRPCGTAGAEEMGKVNSEERPYPQWLKL